MSDDICLLVTFLYEKQLLRVAVKFKNYEISEESLLYYLEPKSQEEIKSKLPQHISSLGEIVEIQKIFDVCVVSTNN